MKFLIFILPLFLVHCFEKTEFECGCEDRNREAVEVQVRPDLDPTGLYEDILLEVDRENADIYGVCIVNGRADRDSANIVFCARDEREYREISNRNQKAQFRIIRRIEN